MGISQNFMMSLALTFTQARLPFSLPVSLACVIFLDVVLPLPYFRTILLGTSVNSWILVGVYADN